MLLLVRFLLVMGLKVYNSRSFETPNVHTLKTIPLSLMYSGTAMLINAGWWQMQRRQLCLSLNIASTGSIQQHYY